MFLLYSSHTATNKQVFWIFHFSVLIIVRGKKCFQWSHLEIVKKRVLLAAALLVKFEAKAEAEASHSLWPRLWKNLQYRYRIIFAVTLLYKVDYMIFYL